MFFLTWMKNTGINKCEENSGFFMSYISEVGMNQEMPFVNFSQIQDTTGGFQ